MCDSYDNIVITSLNPASNLDHLSFRQWHKAYIPHTLCSYISECWADMCHIDIAWYTTPFIAMTIPGLTSTKVQTFHFEDNGDWNLKYVMNFL